MKTHTPGPWTVGAASSNEGEAREIASAGRTVAWTASTWDEDHGDVVTEEDDANARLIAAAPDLLSELKACVEYYGDMAVMDDSQTDMHDRIMLNALAAIRRAEKGDE